MTLSFKNIQTRPIKLQIVRLTDENIQKIAEWIGADQVTVSSSRSRPGRETVTYEFGPNAAQNKLTAYFGDWVALRKAHTDVWGDELRDEFVVIRNQYIHNYDPQNKEQ